MPKLRTGKRRTWLVGTALLAVAVALAWSQRRPIAASAIDRELATRGVQASYSVADVGFRTQRIEKLRLGDPADPDLTAEWTEVSLVPTLGGVKVTKINARGVRLRGRLAQGRVTWGALDKLLPAPSGKPFALPEIDLRLADSRLVLATDLGAVTAEIAGAGKLDDGFSGQIRAVSAGLGRDGCQLAAPAVVARVTVRQRVPRIAGALSARPSSCAGIDTGPIGTRFDVTLGAIDRWTGRVDIRTEGLRRDALVLANPNARISFSGTRDETGGRFALAAPAGRYATTRIAGLSADGTFGAGKAITANGRANVARAIPDPAQVAALRRAFGGAAGTPLGPLAEALANAIGRAGQGAAVSSAFSYDNATTRLSDVRISAAGGGMLTLRDGAIVFDAASASADGVLSLSGGGFPAIVGRFARGVDGTTRGSFDAAPYRAGLAQIVLAPVRVEARGDGSMQASSEALIDGPLASGRVEGIRIPLTVRRTRSGDVYAGQGCTPVAFRRIVIDDATMAPGKMTLCPTTGGALVRSTEAGFRAGARSGPFNLSGRIGDQPLQLHASAASFELGGPLALSDLSAKIGAGDRITALRVARISGGAGRGGLSGRFTGLSGNIAKVPLLASAGQGRWSFAKGALDIDGALRLADAAATIRFEPLIVDTIRLRLKDGRVAGTGLLREPVSARTLAGVTLSHDLAKVQGEARIAVDGLVFGKSLQPEAITPLTEGVVADVYGQLDGTGTMRWVGDTVTSDGKFRTDALDFAAAFGTVTGASGEIVFDDLIALSTPSGQQLRIPLANPGVEVKDGLITYRLRPGQVVEIENGHWPFAGGDLSLDPATLDFGRSVPRRLSFRLSGLDAGKFIEQLKLENIAATGTFDGTLPIVFDATGGRIEGGRVVARPGGGLLAYVGEVSNAQTNTMTQLAFDALKSIRYGNLAIDLDGSLDGEIVSLVRFDGVNQAPVAPSGIVKSFVGLPFRFNIRVRAPFRGLIGTARSFQDPGLLLNRTVQPAASDPRP